MSSDFHRRERPVSDRLHPLVFMAIVGLALWFVVSAWGFATDGYTDYLLAVVSGFILIAVALSYVLWRVWRKPKVPTRNAARRDRRNSNSGCRANSIPGRIGSRAPTRPFRFCCRLRLSHSA
jgi:hypothetical protein